MLGLGAALLLASQAIRFVLRDPLHYVLDPTPASFGSHYWPHRGLLLAHIAGGVTALLTGPFQLWAGLRRRSLRVHRLTGYVYIGGIVLGGGAACALAVYADPRDFGVAMAALALAWWVTVGMAVVAIRHRRVEAHRQWMIRGYVLTFAFVTFRELVDLPLWAFLGDARPATVGWICWVLPLLGTEVALQWRQSVGARQI